MITVLSHISYVHEKVKLVASTPVILSVIHHRQNPLESTCCYVFLVEEEVTWGLMSINSSKVVLLPHSYYYQMFFQECNPPELTRDCCI
jgi:hypothetical protein